MIVSIKKHSLIMTKYEYSSASTATVAVVVSCNLRHTVRVRYVCGLKLKPNSESERRIVSEWRRLTTPLPFGLVPPRASLLPSCLTHIRPVLVQHVAKPEYFKIRIRMYFYI